MILRFRPWEKHIIKRLIEPHNQALGRFPQLQVDSHHFVVEEVLEGRQVNVDGFVHEGRFQLLGSTAMPCSTCQGATRPTCMLAMNSSTSDLAGRRPTER